MQVAIIGLGRIGNSIALHLLEQGVSVIAYNRSPEKVTELAKSGAIPALTLEDIPKKATDSPLVVLLYVPAGAVDGVLFSQLPQKGLIDILPPGAIIIDGGNSFYKDSQARAQKLQARGFHFLDMGTSGGLEGARTGACLMVGGNKALYTQVEPLLAKIATADGYGYFGPSGAGHFVKMIHNAIEYGMMGAIGDGLNIISNFQLPISNEKEANFRFDLQKLTKVWAHGSIISGLLMDKTAAALAKDPQLASVGGSVPKGETEVEMEWLTTLGIPHPVIEAARNERVETRTKPSFIGQVIAALRREFGGHRVNPQS
jgi:6-phosphogluconate dehydrogenase